MSRLRCWWIRSCTLPNVFASTATWERAARSGLRHLGRRDRRQFLRPPLAGDVHALRPVPSMCLLAPTSPPSTRVSHPEMHAAASDSKHATADPMSSARPGNDCSVDQRHFDHRQHSALPVSDLDDQLDAPICRRETW